MVDEVAECSRALFTHAGGCLDVRIDFLPALASCLVEQLISFARLIITLPACLFTCLFLSLCICVWRWRRGL